MKLLGGIIRSINECFRTYKCYDEMASFHSNILPVREALTSITLAVPADFTYILTSPSLSLELQSRHIRCNNALRMADPFKVTFQQGLDAIGNRSSKFWNRTRDVILVNWHLGLTAFGGPAVHYQLVRKCIFSI